MASYLIFTPPGAGRNDESARFVADGFSKTAFVFPAIWLSAKNQWFFGLAALAGQIAALRLVSDGLFPSGLALQAAISLLVALEGGQMVAGGLERRGWTFRAVILADRMETAEDLYFESDPEPATAPAATLDRPAGTSNRGSGMALGLFDLNGSR